MIVRVKPNSIVRYIIHHDIVYVYIRHNSTTTSFAFESKSSISINETAVPHRDSINTTSRITSDDKSAMPMKHGTIIYNNVGTSNVGYVHGPKSELYEGSTSGDNIWGEAKSSAALSAFYRFMFDPEEHPPDTEEYMVYAETGCFILFE